MIEQDLESSLIKSRLGENSFIENLMVVESVDSTNEMLKRELDNLNNNTLAVAMCQNNGKGSKGRSWSSPAGSGIWMSMLIYPEITLDKAPMLTLVMALSVAKACKDIYNIHVQIKWPNDIVCNGRKVCGILTEVKQQKTGRYGVIIGMGINVNTEFFPEELKDIATSVYIETGKKWQRADLIGEIIRCFSHNYRLFLQESDLSLLLRAYSSMSATIGKKVRVLDLQGEYEATAVSVGKDGCLLVQCQDGQTRRIFGDEVSVRGIYGYV